MERLLNEENVWELEVHSDAKEDPECIIIEEEASGALSEMTHGQSADGLNLVSEMQKASEVGVVWFACLRNWCDSEKKMPAQIGGEAYLFQVNSKYT